MQAWDFYTTNELKARGWLKRQLEIQASGRCGHLDSVWPDVRDSAWIGGSREGWERVPYWLDGFIPLAYLLEDRDMIARAGRYVDAILRAQRPDGWICPCKDEERSGYDPWAVLLISKVLTVCYDCSKDVRIPEALYRLLRNAYELLQSGEIRLFNWGKFRYFEGLIAVCFLYAHCGEDWLLRLAALLKAQGTDYGSLTGLWKTPLNRWRFETHIVNIAMMLKAEALECTLTGAPYTDQAEALHKLLERYNGTPVGLFTGDECLSGLSPIQGTELCAVVEQMYAYEWLYACTGEDKWAERLELLAFNALPAACSDDMWAHQYVQMSNQIACEIFPGKPVFRTNGADAHIFGLEPNFGCCTANFGQGWPKFSLSAFLHRGDTVVSAVPVPSELTDGGIHIVLETDYPFENRLVYTVETDRPFTLVVRAPSFAENLTVNGEAPSGELRFSFRAGDRRTLELRFGVTPRFASRPHGLSAVRCGSLVFSVPIAYEKRVHEYVRDVVERKAPYCDYEYLPRSDWNYAYCGSLSAPARKAVGKVPFSSEAPPVVLRSSVRKIGWGYEDGYETVCAKVPRCVVPVSEPEEVLLYPYGCAKLRMTELPVVDGIKP